MRQETCLPLAGEGRVSSRGPRPGARGQASMQPSSLAHPRAVIGAGGARSAEAQPEQTPRAWRGQPLASGAGAAITGLGLRRRSRSRRQEPGRGQPLASGAGTSVTGLGLRRRSRSKRRTWRGQPLASGAGASVTGLGLRRRSRSRRQEPGRGQPSRQRRDGAPGRARTCDLRLRRPTLYPTELRARTGQSRRIARGAPCGPARRIVIPPPVPPRRTIP